VNAVDILSGGSLDDIVLGVRVVVSSFNGLFVVMAFIVAGTTVYGREKWFCVGILVTNPNKQCDYQVFSS
jgi:hypothetical protein